MSTKWFRRVRREKELLVFDKTNAWSATVQEAIKTFNNLNFGVKLTKTKEKNLANIVVKLSLGADSYTHYDWTATTKSDFDPKNLHGLTSSKNMESRREIEREFAVIFLPGKAKATAKQKEMVVLHEFIHAARMDEHDSVGIMYDIMRTMDNGLIEGVKTEAKPMPPVRVGAKTSCTLLMLWANDESCE